MRIILAWSDGEVAMFLTEDWCYSLFGRTTQVSIERKGDLDCNYKSFDVIANNLRSIVDESILHIVRCHDTNAILQMAHASTDISHWIKRCEATKIAFAGGCTMRDIDILDAQGTWIFDSGASDDVIALTDLDAGAKALVNRALTTSYATAAGIERSLGTIPMEAECLFGTKMRINVMKNTPALISMGRRVLDDRCSFIWTPDNCPVLINSEGKFLLMQISQYCPKVSSNSFMGDMSNPEHLRHLQECMSGPVVDTIRGTLLSAKTTPAGVSVGTQCTMRHDSVDAEVQCDPMPTLHAIIRDDQDDRDSLLHTIEDLTSSVTQLKQAAGLFEIPGRVSLTISEAESLRNKVQEQQHELEQLRSLLRDGSNATTLTQGGNGCSEPYSTDKNNVVDVQEQPSYLGYALPNQELLPDESEDAEGDIREFNRPGEDASIPLQSTDEYDDETAEQLHEVCFDLSGHDSTSTQGLNTTETTANDPVGSTDPVETPGSSSGHVGTEVIQSDGTDDDLEVDPCGLEDDNIECLPCDPGPIGMSDTDVDDSTLMRRSLKEIAMSEEHLRTHMPALPNHCETCRRAKRMQRRKLRRHRGATNQRNLGTH